MPSLLSIEGCTGAIAVLRAVIGFSESCDILIINILQKTSLTEVSTWKILYLHRYLCNAKTYGDWQSPPVATITINASHQLAVHRTPCQRYSFTVIASSRPPVRWALLWQGVL